MCLGKWSKSRNFFPPLVTFNFFCFKNLKYKKFLLQLHKSVFPNVCTAISCHYRLHLKWTNRSAQRTICKRYYDYCVNTFYYTLEFHLSTLLLAVPVSNQPTSQHQKWNRMTEVSKQTPLGQKPLTNLLEETIAVKWYSKNLSFQNSPRIRKIPIISWYSKFYYQTSRATKQCIHPRMLL